MKTLEVGRCKALVKVDDDFEPPVGASLSVSSSGHVRWLKSTGEKRPSGSYVYTQGYLGRLIMGCPKGQTVLFIDRDKLNLQKENLKIVERGVNVRAQGGQRGGFKGVHFCKKRNKWIAQITHNYKCFSLGGFDDEYHAASAYNQAAVRLHGEHAYINQMPEDRINA